MKADHPTFAAYDHAAWMLRCETAALRAVGEVEAGPYGAFQPDGQPTILYEPHIFHRLTGGRHEDARWAGAPGPGPQSRLSLPSWTPEAYGISAIQHDKLEAAAKLDRAAALKSCSWGLFQIMGFNHPAAGFPDLQRFINAMYREVDDHLRALVFYIRNDSGLVDAIRAKDWTGFARQYNGTGYAKNAYHTKLEAAYRKLQA